MPRPRSDASVEERLTGYARENGWTPGTGTHSTPRGLYPAAHYSRGTDHIRVIFYPATGRVYSADLMGETRASRTSRGLREIRGWLWKLGDRA